MSKKPFESYPCRLEVCSPIHIGTGDDLTPFDYFVDRDQVIVYNLQKLLREHSTFTRQLSARSEEFKDERDFFLRKILEPEQREDRGYWSYALDATSAVQRRIQDLQSRGNRANINCFIRDGRVQPYIPGSSLKGAIRTAYAYHVFKQDGRRNAELFQRLWRESNRIVDMLIFEGKPRLGAQGDLFRALMISDVIGFSQRMRVEVTRTLSSTKMLGYVNLFETLVPEDTGTFVLTVQKELVRRFGDRLEWDLLEEYPLTKEMIPHYCRSFYGDLISFDREYFAGHPMQSVAGEITGFYDALENQSLRDGEFVVRLGQGGGFFGKTMAMLLANDHSFDYARFVGRFGRRIRGEVTQARKPEKSSRVILDSNEQYPVFGWVKLTLDAPVDRVSTLPQVRSPKSESPANHRSSQQPGPKGRSQSRGTKEMWKQLKTKWEGK